MSTLAINIPVPLSGDGPIVSISSLVGPKTVLLSGHYIGTYTLLASQDDVNFVPILQFDAGGIEGIEQTVPGSLKSMRLRAGISSAPIGTVTCSVSGIVEAGTSTNQFATVATLAVGFRGTTPSIDTHALFPPSGLEDTICYLCRGLFQGQVSVEGSNDNVAWNPIGAFQAPFVPTDLLGLSNVLEFFPIDTADKTRYVRLNVLGATTGTVVVTVGGSTPGTGYALTDLSNLTPTAINMSLVPNAGGTIDLGSTLKPWRNLFLTTAITGTQNNTLTISVPSQGTANADGAGIQIMTDAGGSGGSGNHDGGSLSVVLSSGSGSGVPGRFSISALANPTSGNSDYTLARFACTIDQTGGANGTLRGLVVDLTESSVLGVDYLLDLQVGGVSKYSIRGTAPITSSAGATWDGHLVSALTQTVRGNTGIATAAGFNEITIRAPTIAGDTATCTITNAATFAISGAPTAGANVAITNPYALWVQAGRSRLDGPLTVNNDVSLTGALTGATSLAVGVASAGGYTVWIQSTNPNLRLASNAETSGLTQTLYFSSPGFDRSYVRGVNVGTIGGGQIEFHTTLASTGVPSLRMTIGNDGVVNLASLAGVGTRPVLADAAGNLSAP